MRVVVRALSSSVANDLGEVSPLSMYLSGSLWNAAIMGFRHG